MPNFLKYKLMFFVALGVFLGAGQLKADPVCGTNTLAYYIANVTTSANGCSIDGLNFWGFNGANAGTTSSGPVSAGFNASEIELTPITTSGQAGFTITPLNSGGLQGNATGVADAEVPFMVACADGTNCLTNIFMSITGSATGTTMGGQTPGQAKLTETYCLGGNYVPPTGPCSGGSVMQQLLTLSPMGTGSASQTDTFAGVSELSMNKDIQALGNNGSASVTSVEDLFASSTPSSSSVPATPPTPEPASIVLLGLGLAGLTFVSVRQRHSC